MIYVDPDTWPRITLNGVTYAVAPRYIGPLGIGEAEETAAHHGCELPTPALVDAIYTHADCKLDAQRFVRSHDGTLATMAAPAVMLAQANRVQAAIVAWEREHGPAALVAGGFKDVVRLPSGKPGLYGWHRLDGSVIQPAFGGHGRSWRDYSQGLRLTVVA